MEWIPLDGNHYDTKWALREPDSPWNWAVVYSPNRGVREWRIIIWRGNQWVAQPNLPADTPLDEVQAYALTLFRMGG